MTFLPDLLKLQKEALTLDLPKSKVNPHFHNRYTPLDVVLGAVIPLCNAHGFVVIQNPCIDDGAAALHTRLMHAKTGEELSDTMLLSAGKADPQGQGAAITYARRYSIMSMLGLTSDEDDDGNSSRAHTGSKATVASTSTYRQPVESMDDDGNSPI